MFLSPKHRTVNSAKSFFEEIGLTKPQISSVFSGLSPVVLNNIKNGDNKVERTNRILLELLNSSPELISLLLPNEVTYKHIVEFFNSIQNKNILINGVKLTKGRFLLMLGYSSTTFAGVIFKDSSSHKAVQTSVKSVFILLREQIHGCGDSTKCEQQIFERFWHLSKEVK